MSQDDETSVKELVTVLQMTGVSISKFTALKVCHLLGWTSFGTAYCQSVRTRNREKRLHCAQEYLGAGFDVIWSDETTVQMETHRPFCCRTIGCDINPALSTLMFGSHQSLYFGMDAKFYCQILDDHLVPYMRSVYLHSHRFMQDNDPKHTSGRA